MPDQNLSEENPNTYIIKGFNLKDLNAIFILKHLSTQVDTHLRGYFNLFPEQIEIDYAAFSQPDADEYFPIVQLWQNPQGIKLSCRCAEPKHRLCSHQAQVLYNILKRASLRIFFDAPLRKQEILREAQSFGLENESELDELFVVQYVDDAIKIKPKIPFQPFDKKAQEELKTILLPEFKSKIPVKTTQSDNNKVIVLTPHRYYNHLIVELFEADKTKNNKLKNPLKRLDPADLIFTTENADLVKFFSAVAGFQQNYDAELSEKEMNAIKAIVKNPMHWPFYLHDSKISANIQSSSVLPVYIHILDIDLCLSVNQKDDFYEITGRISIGGKTYELDNLMLKYQYFIQLKDQLYLIPRLDFLRVIGYFIKQSNRLILHKSKYPEFQKSILIPLEGNIRVDYSYLKPATKKQIEEKGFDLENEKLVYLSESEDFVLITPVMRYGNVEIPVLSKKQIQARDKMGNVFTVHRDEKAELQFIAEILRQHEFFYEQESNDSFYLHRKRFLESGWFLETFETWRNKNIHILGFNQLKNNKLNPFKAEINIEVLSGTDWFETKAQVKFGKQKVALKYLHKSIRNKSKFVTLDDGTQGILPEEWLVKFTQYFNAGEVVEEQILTPKISFATLDEIYEDALLDGKVRNEIISYKQKFDDTNAIKEVSVPEALLTELRPYQHEGLNWLNFLDDFNFGGCLADDMGLGKTVQVLAFMLSQREKVSFNTNLVVVPASLIFNWTDEIQKFAPSLRVKVIYGSDRSRVTEDFDAYDVILTSYGILLSDIHFLKEYRFNYIFLDESQNIKNPESQRYKAARMLQSRNKIVLSGTPIENNTFDLYGQLSFACLGLFGSKQQFADLYSTPIDQFKDSKRAAELQRKIKPFILRRTKERVAKELPEKTEIVLYCEMGEEQREVYEANKKEIQDYILKKTDDELPKSAMHVLKGITRLRQICNSAALLADGKSYVQSSSKIEILIEQIQSKARNHKILVFSQFVSMLELVKKQLELKDIKYAYLTGQTRNRKAAVDYFQESDDVPVFLISLKAGGTGLNLTKADYVYLVDPWWNPAVENQAIDRAYRIGQKKNVMAVRLICPDTIEEKIMKLQATKKDLVRDVIQTDGSFFKKLNRQELLGLLS